MEELQCQSSTAGRGSSSSPSKLSAKMADAEDEAKRWARAAVTAAAAGRQRQEEAEKEERGGLMGVVSHRPEWHFCTCAAMAAASPGTSNGGLFGPKSQATKGMAA